MSTSTEGATPRVFTTPTSPEQQLEYFAQLVRKGRRADASNCEHCSYYLAVTFVCNLDDEAIRGLDRFIALAKHQPKAARDLVS